MAVVEERGLFWWSDIERKPGKYAPSASVSGLLTISDEGSIKLEIEGQLSGDDSWAYVQKESESLSNKYIVGRLRNNQHILLSDIASNGPVFQSDNQSRHTYVALHCLVGDRALPQLRKLPKSTELHIPLDGLEEWLGLDSIQTSRTKRSISVRYRKQDTLGYPLDGGRLEIKRIIHAPFLGRQLTHEVILRQAFSLVYKSDIPFTINDSASHSQLIEDFFLLLTDCDYAMRWPIIHFGKGKRRSSYQHYFLRRMRPSEAPARHKCLAQFELVKENLGDLFARFKHAREEHGPGLYLYFSTRSGMPFYHEHVFTSLISGLESLHRSTYLEKVKPALAAKIERILSSVEAKDKRWLERKLLHSGEPNLERRIYQILDDLPLEFTSESKEKFSKSCANYRNDLFHFGKQKRGTDVASINDQIMTGRALSIVYHMTILKQIGVDEAIIRDAVYGPGMAYYRRWTLVKAGLLDQSYTDRALAE